MRKLLASALAVVAIGVFAASTAEPAEAATACRTVNNKRECGSNYDHVPSPTKTLVTRMLSLPSRDILNIKCSGKANLWSVEAGGRYEATMGAYGTCVASLTRNRTVRFEWTSQESRSGTSSSSYRSSGLMMMSSPTASKRTGEAAWQTGKGTVYAVR